VRRSLFYSLLVATVAGPHGPPSPLVGPEDDTWHLTGIDWWRQTLEVTWRACQLAGRRDLGVGPTTQREFKLSIERVVALTSRECKSSTRETGNSTRGEDTNITRERAQTVPGRGHKQYQGRGHKQFKGRGHKQYKGK